MGGRAIVVQGPCVPTARPRQGRRGNFYIPGRSPEYREAIAAAWRSRHGVVALSGPLKITIRFVNPGRGDIDNLVKTVLDGLQGVAFGDDRNVVELHATIIRRRDRQPCTEIELACCQNGGDNGKTV